MTRDIYDHLHQHIVSIGEGGLLLNNPPIGNNEAGIQHIFENEIPSVIHDWPVKRLMFHCHGGLTDEGPAIDWIDNYRQIFLDAHIFPLAFIWHSGLSTTLHNALKPPYCLPLSFPTETHNTLNDDAHDSMVAEVFHACGGPLIWSTMKKEALMASLDPKGGARIVLKYLQGLLKQYPDLEIHLLGHSAGSTFYAPFIKILTSSGLVDWHDMAGTDGVNIDWKQYNNIQGLGRAVKSCVLWAPACTLKLFKPTYLSAYKNNKIDRLVLFTMDDDTERNDYYQPPFLQEYLTYYKSLLYLVSDAFEEHHGEPLLGMAKFLDPDPDIQAMLRETERFSWIKSPQIGSFTAQNYSTALHHGAFKTDIPTIISTLNIIKTACGQLQVSPL